MDAVERLADLPFADALERFEGELGADGDYDTVLFDGIEFDETDAPHARFIECALTSVGFHRGRLRGARFNEVWAQALRVVGTDLAETEWLDSTLVSGMLAGADAYNAKLRRVRFAGCKLEGVNLRGAELVDVDFEDCTLSDVDFAGARLTGVRFPGSTLRTVRMDNAALRKVDLRGARELDIASGYKGLGGALITGAQLIQIAPVLAKELNITVRDR